MRRGIAPPQTPPHCGGDTASPYPTLLAAFGRSIIPAHAVMWLVNVEQGLF